MSKTKSFVKEVLARMKGDTVAVTAEKNYRKATAGIGGQIAALKSKLVEEEGRVDDAKDALDNAKYPVDMIADTSSYVKKIKEKQDAYDKAKEDLEAVQHSITYYEELLASFDVEETAEAEA
jgi:hypothetical protein